MDKVDEGDLVKKELGVLESKHAHARNKNGGARTPNACCSNTGVTRDKKRENASWLKATCNMPITICGKVLRRTVHSHSRLDSDAQMQWRAKRLHFASKVGD